MSRPDIIQLIGAENVKSFEDFAFGCDPSEFEFWEVPQKWNALHPDNPIYLYGDTKRDVAMMVDLWRKHNDRSIA